MFSLHRISIDFLEFQNFNETLIRSKPYEEFLVRIFNPRLLTSNWKLDWINSKIPGKIATGFVEWSLRQKLLQQTD